MSNWSDTRYFCFPDYATALALFEQLGGEMNDQGIPIAGNSNYTMVGPIQEGNRRPVSERDDTGAPVITDPGDVFPGSWWMGKLNRDWTKYTVASAALAHFDQTEKILGTDDSPRVPWNRYA